MKYDREKASIYLNEYQQYMNKMKDNRRPPGFYKDFLTQEQILRSRKLLDIFPDDLLKYDTIEFYMLLIVFEAAIKKAAAKLFKGNIDFPEYGTADTKEFNAHLITPNNEKDASFIIFNIIQHRFLSALSRLIAKIFIEVGYFEKAPHILLRLEHYLSNDFSINLQYIKTILTFFYPDLIKYERNIAMYKDTNISAHTCGFSMMFLFSHEYSHFILDHEYKPIKDIVINQTIYSDNKRNYEDELFCDLCAVKLMAENLDTDLKEINTHELLLISIYQLFFAMQVTEKYNEHQDKTHPPVNMRINNLKVFFDEDDHYKKYDQIIFDIVENIFIILDATNRNVIMDLLNS